MQQYHKNEVASTRSKSHNSVRRLITKKLIVKLTVALEHLSVYFQFNLTSIMTLFAEWAFKLFEISGLVGLGQRLG